MNILKYSIENGKKREIEIDAMYGTYSYRESIPYKDTKEYIETISLAKGSDYSFYYLNMSDEEKTGTFTIEKDSEYITPFINLVGRDGFLSIEDDYSERTITFRRNKDNSVTIHFYLLPGEMDGSIEIKNIIYDTRSKADSYETNIKERLSLFFDDLLKLTESKKFKVKTIETK